jgi:hypothetical protein
MIKKVSSIKKTTVATNKFAPKVLGNERAKLLTDTEMVGMHKNKNGQGMAGKNSRMLPKMPKARMIMNSGGGSY